MSGDYFAIFLLLCIGLFRTYSFLFVLADCDKLKNSMTLIILAPFLAFKVSSIFMKIYLHPNEDVSELTIAFVSSEFVHKIGSCP